MPLPVLLAHADLAVNLGLKVWLERARARGETPAVQVATLASALRWGPPAAGAIYLVVITGDWAFVAFVAAFFAGAFWLLNGLLAYTNHDR
jgi:hypothetical protein